MHSKEPSVGIWVYKNAQNMLIPGYAPDPTEQLFAHQSWLSFNFGVHNKLF